MAEVIREMLRRGSYQMPGESLPYEVQANAMAAHLSAAGFGLVADAVVIHVPHDTEAHARSFNEGYEASVTQGLTDDPTLADDWFQEKLREARAEALEDSANWLDSAEQAQNIAFDGPSDLGALSAKYESAIEEPAEWLRARAVAEREADRG